MDAAPRTRRRLVRRLLLVVPLACCAELASCAAFWIQDGEPFSYARLDAELRRVSQGEERVETADPEQALEAVIHPYLGFVNSPESNTAEREKRHRGHRIGALGFEGDALQRRASDRVLVGVVGGSVAHWMVDVAGDVLAAELQRGERFRGRRVEIVQLAVPGHKQPQQLMTVCYLLALGGELDVLVNLDGFNDVALARANLDRGVSPAFPGNWDKLAAAGRDAGQLARLGRLEAARDARAEAARGMADSLASCTVTGLLAWRLRDRILQSRVAEAATRLEAYVPPTAGFAQVGPGAAGYETPELYDRLADVWASASIQLARLCEANRIEYHHFLQPNQYLEGSKPMGDDERRVAVREGSAYQRSVGEGYLLFASRGPQLRAEGVDFHDLCQVFATIPEALYIDACCHVNERGNRILAQEVARAVLNGR